MILFYLRILLRSIRHLKPLKKIACLFRKKKVVYTKSQLTEEFNKAIIKELEMVKKEIEVTKTELQDEPNGNVLPKEEAAPTQSKAYSIVFDVNLKKWLAVEVTFDYQAGTLGGIKVIESNP